MPAIRLRRRRNGRERGLGYAYKIKPGEKVRWSDYDPDENGGMKKPEGEAEAARLGEELGRLQDLLFAAGEKALLIVLQGMDTSGKDGLIRHLATYLNAQSCNVVPFKQPTQEDLSHDFLWRIHPCVPARGRAAIFNRSHYEDVLIVRVHRLAPEEVWKRRYEQINQFERLLTDSDTIVLKFFLHISREEQEQRLLDREKEPEKAWKLSVQDWRERELWNDYASAYEAALERCSEANAPWHVVPANRKWFRNLAVTESIVKTLRPYRDHWLESLEKRGEAALREIEAFRKSPPGSKA
jgi:PPK2 family polyphosphate:nucleotide phosphotransferase